MASGSRFTPARVEKLLGDPGIIRNRAKVGVHRVRNASGCPFLAVQEEFGSFDAYAGASWAGGRWSTSGGAWRSSRP